MVLLGRSSLVFYVGSVPRFRWGGSLIGVLAIPKVGRAPGFPIFLSSLLFFRGVEGARRALCGCGCGCGAFVVLGIGWLVASLLGGRLLR